MIARICCAYTDTTGTLPPVSNDLAEFRKYTDDAQRWFETLTPKQVLEFVEAQK
jgi:hypothetical protein